MLQVCRVSKALGLGDVCRCGDQDVPVSHQPAEDKTAFGLAADPQREIHLIVHQVKVPIGDQNYTAIFQAIGINITFEIAEAKLLSPEWAFLRSTSNGTATILASGAQIPSRNHELFVLHKSRGCWKIARYSFSSVLPSAK